MVSSASIGQRLGPGTHSLHAIARQAEHLGTDEVVVAPRPSAAPPGASCRSPACGAASWRTAQAQACLALGARQDLVVQPAAEVRDRGARGALDRRHVLVDLGVALPRPTDGRPRPDPGRSARRCRPSWASASCAWSADTGRSPSPSSHCRPRQERGQAAQPPTNAAPRCAHGAKSRASSEKRPPPAMRTTVSASQAGSRSSVSSNSSASSASSTSPDRSARPRSARLGRVRSALPDGGRSARDVPGGQPRSCPATCRRGHGSRLASPTWAWSRRGRRAHRAGRDRRPSWAWVGCRERGSEIQSSRAAS